jgi:hypothetical protein
MTPDVKAIKDRESILNQFDAAIAKDKAASKVIPLVWETPTYKIIPNMNLVCFLPESHILRRMSIQAAFEMNLPVNTVFLMGLGVVAAMACRCFCTSYEYGKRLPIGLYVVGEQPPSAAKSWCLNFFQEPFADIYSSIADLGGKPAFTVTNATPEALEQTLLKTNGFFSIVSSEKGILNSLLGMSYTSSDRANNNDVVLNGYDGGFVSNARVTRECYSGRVGGGIVCFAQDGSVESILKASNGQGVSERFLMIAEGHKLGSRDHTKKAVYDRDLIADYASICSFFSRAVSTPCSLDNMDLLKIPVKGFVLINEYRNTIEPFLADGEKYSHSFLRGSAGKIDIQIMKISACLHIMSGDIEMSGLVIGIDTIVAAIGIADALLNNTWKLCSDKEVFGIKSEDAAIITYLGKSSKPRPMIDLINSLRTTKPFKEMSNNKSEAIRKSVEKMVEKRKLAITFDLKGSTLYSLL